jgi:hypothetical protein
MDASTDSNYNSQKESVHQSKETIYLIWTGLDWTGLDWTELEATP